MTHDFEFAAGGAQILGHRALLQAKARRDEYSRPTLRRQSRHLRFTLRKLGHRRQGSWNRRACCANRFCVPDSEQAGRIDLGVILSGATSAAADVAQSKDPYLTRDVAVG